MKIDYRPDVFDDPEYCQSLKGFCDHIVTRRNHDGFNEYTCGLFTDKYGILVELGVSSNPLKCGECKEHYAARIPPKPLPEGHRLG